jgi:hypothetical protein
VVHIRKSDEWKKKLCEQVMAILNMS